VIHEHDALELASTAMDFPLSEADTEKLREAVADCPICAERGAAYRRHGRLLAELPHLEASAEVQRRVMLAAAAGRQIDTRTPMLLLAAALLLGALLTVAAAAGGLFQPRTLSAIPLNSTEPSASAPGPGPSSGPIAVASLQPEGIRLSPDSIADVVANNVRIRSQPRVAADSFKLEPLLRIGDRLFVIAGPVAADNYDWYEVAAWRPSTAAVTWPVGWVARADHNGTPWVQEATPNCPAAPAIDSLVAMDPHEALACYGHEAITVRAFVLAVAPDDGCQLDGVVRRCLVGPGWLARSGARTAATAPSSHDGLRLAFDPAGSLAAADLPAAKMSVIVGAFDHPASADCLFDGYPSGTPTSTGDEAILRCRMHFVVESATPAATPS
jgi:hypothetical protein